MVTFDSSFVLNHTCLRVKDPKVSVPFYEKNFGMKLIRQLDFNGCTLYILNIETDSNKDVNWSGREGILELCHEHGSESDDSFKVNNGNGEEFRGFGHICFSVDNIGACEKRLLDNKVAFKKKLADGRQKNIAFALDPDGYWIELVEHGINKAESSTDITSYKFNHSMIRVKDPKKSLDFYKNKLGMKLVATSEFPDAKFTLYFLTYEHDKDFVENSVDVQKRHSKNSLIELTYNWGSETDDNVKYHNGNSTEGGAIKGFGHFCVSCKDAAKFCKELDQEFGDELDWSVRWGEHPLSPNIAFIRDPDGYSIEIIPPDLFQ